MNKEHYTESEWKIIENQFSQAGQEAAESLFSIGNGKMGQRANFEEYYSGKSLQGSYIAGVYYPDKTRVGWWKNGYPEYFAKVLNSPSWIGVDVNVGGERLDLAVWEVSEFVRELDMKQGLLLRSFVATSPRGQKIKVIAKRFVSMDDSEAGLLSYSVESINVNGSISFSLGLDGDVYNEDANYDEQFWEVLETHANNTGQLLTAKTRKLNFKLALAGVFTCFFNGEEVEGILSFNKTEKTCYTSSIFTVSPGDVVRVEKYVSVLSSLNHHEDELAGKSMAHAVSLKEKGFTSLLERHVARWESIWENSDIVIEGDVAAQQGIRFNIFQLNQTYTGEDARLNIGPKGFTGEKYGGSTYWDTEAYCLPFYLNTAPYKVARQLLVYRYEQLDKAIENAAKLGFKNGAALYPMVTMNGEECHNEWEITFEEIHRNGAIAFAIFNYIRHSGDKRYLAEYGLEVLIAIARFWAQRFNFSEAKQQYVMLGVTGPNEYENNVNNNFYTNYIAAWCLSYAQEAALWVKGADASRYAELCSKMKFSEDEFQLWENIYNNTYYPKDDERGVFLQQEGFLDKELKSAAVLKDSERPINQHWSWDRILRSCYIKQADTLQGLYLFEDQFEEDVIRRNYEFYEPMTVHESSLSPCVHTVLAAKLGKMEDAYKLYLRTSRLDLDDYNREVHEGLHITSMAGTWISVIEGFGGLRIQNDKPMMYPRLPQQWKRYAFKIQFRGSTVKVSVGKEGVGLTHLSGEPISMNVYGQEVNLTVGESKTIQA